MGGVLGVKHSGESPSLPLCHDPVPPVCSYLASLGYRYQDQQGKAALTKYSPSAPPAILLPVP